MYMYMCTAAAEYCWVRVWHNSDDTIRNIQEYWWEEEKHTHNGNNNKR